MFKKFPQREEGQGLVEYALILVLVAIVVIAILLQLGPAINQAFLKVTTVLKGEDMGVMVSYSPSTTTIGPVTTLNVNVSVTTASNVTLSTGAGSDTQSCNTSCTLSVSGVPASGTFTLSAAAGGQITGSY